MQRKKGQVSIEYLIIVGFITLLVISFLGISLIYYNSTADKIKFNQLESFNKKILSAAENIYYAGEPSKTTISAYLPVGMESIQILESEIVFNITTQSGNSIKSYTSNVPLNGSISPISGVKNIKLTATQNYVLIED